MRTSRYVQTLASGPLDIVGDVHGEIEALEDLLKHLGWGDGTTPHPDGRTLVFVGDLVDRGPDSPAVVRRVQALVEAGLAQCVLGNHELAMVLDEAKPDNNWLRGVPQDFESGAMVPQRYPADAEAADSLNAFVRTLPLALYRDDLRVAHAAWVDRQIEKLLDAGDLPLKEINKGSIEAIKSELGGLG